MKPGGCGGLRLGRRRSEEACRVTIIISPLFLWLVGAAAGTAWLLQFIEDMQQSRDFHETCELELPKGQAAKIPEVRYSY